MRGHESLLRDSGAGPEPRRGRAWRWWWAEVRGNRRNIHLDTGEDRVGNTHERVFVGLAANRSRSEGRL